MHPRFLRLLAFALISFVALSSLPTFLPVVTGAERFVGRKAPTDVAPSVPVHVTLTVSSPPALNEVAQLLASVTSDTDAENLIIEVSLPKGMSRITGDLSWTGDVRAGSTSSLSLTVKAIAIGNWTVRAKAGYPVAGGWYGDVAEITLSVQEHAGFVAQVRHPLTMLPAVPVSLAEVPAGPFYQFQGNVTPSPPGVPSHKGMHVSQTTNATSVQSTPRFQNGTWNRNYAVAEAPPNHWWLIDYWNAWNYYGSFTALANSITGLSSGDDVLILPLNLAYGSSTNLEWFQFDIDFNGGANGWPNNIWWGIWNVDAPSGCSVYIPDSNYHPHTIGLTYTIGHSYHYTGSIVVGSFRFQIWDDSAGTNWYMDFSVPSTSQVYDNSCFSPASALEGYTTPSSVSNVLYYQFTIGYGMTSYTFGQYGSGLPNGLGMDQQNLGGTPSAWHWEMTGSTPDFQISADPVSLTFTKPSSGSTSQTSTITVTSLNGWVWKVDLSGSWVGTTPNDVAYSLNPVSVTPPSSGTSTSTLTVTVGPNSYVGTYTLRVWGTSGLVARTVDVAIIINPPPPPPGETWPRAMPNPTFGFTVPNNYYKGCSSGGYGPPDSNHIGFWVIGDETGRSSLIATPSDFYYVNPYSDKFVIIVSWNSYGDNMQQGIFAPAGSVQGFDRGWVVGNAGDQRMEIYASKLYWGYPTALSASAISSSQINLAWTSNTNGAESSFRIERKTGSAGTYSEVATVGSGSTSYSDTGLSGGTSYYYRVRAYSNTYLAYTEYSNEASATTTGTGNTLVTGIFYNYISEDAIPAAGAQRADQLQPMVWGYVEIRDGNGNFLGGEVTGPDTDDSEGRFQISINNPGSVGFYAVMIPSTSAADVLQSDGSSQYSSYTTTITTSASTFDIGGWTPPDDNNYKAAWRAYETLVNDHYGRGAWNFIVNRAGFSSSTLGMVTVEVPSPDGDTYFHEDPSTYIHIGSLTYTMALDILQHEYAHYVMYKVYGSFPSTDCPSPHYINGISGIRCGWTEGWADFFPLMVQSEARGSLGENPDAVFEWGSGSQISLEVPTWGTPGWDNGPQVEGRVAGALNDIYDWTNDPVDSSGGYDAFTDYYANIWDTFSHSYDYTFEDFWSAWKTRGHDQSNNGAVACLFHNTIEYTPPFIVVTTTVLITSTVRSTSYLYQTTTATVTSYTSTSTLTSTIPTVTTVVLLQSTVTSIVQSIQYLTSILTTAVTSYTGTVTSTSTIPTTVALVQSTLASTAQNTEYLTLTRMTTVTSYTGTEVSTSTVVVPTTIVLVPFTVTSTAESTQYLTSTRTTTVTSYTGTETSTIPTVTTVALLPQTMTSTVQSTQSLTSTTTRTVTSYTATTTSTSTSVVYTTVAASPGGAGAGASSPLAYIGFISLLAITLGDRVTAGKRWRIPKVRSLMEGRCSRS